MPILVAAVIASHWDTMSPAERADQNPLDIALAGVGIAQLAIAVLGVLVITGEYSTGMIRASLTAVPKRLPVLWAKAGVFAAVTFALMLPSVLIAFFASQAILARHDILETSFSHPGVARAVVGGALYLMLVGVFALGDRRHPPQHSRLDLRLRRAVLRHPAADEPPAEQLGQRHQPIPAERGRPAARSRSRTTRTTLAPLPGFALFVGYGALALGVAAVLLVRRDA